MIKVWCESCSGQGWTYQAEHINGEYMGDAEIECPDCGGKGFAEWNQNRGTLNVENIELCIEGFDIKLDPPNAAEKELEELIRLAQIGADLEYISGIKYIGNIPTVARVQELARIWREREGKSE